MVKIGRYCYKYPRPAVTVDCILISKNPQQEILLIQRKANPYKNKWALPGGFVDMDEELIDAANRELKEETNIDSINLKQYKTIGTIGRDPRGRTISVIFYTIIDKKLQEAKAGDDAKNLKWISLDCLPELAFDHHKIVQAFRDEILSKEL